MWIYDEKPVDETELMCYIGFVYLISNRINDKKYIGKKLLKFKRTKVVKGKKKRVLIDSDWRTYFGSNKVLIEDVATLGESNFNRIILHLCKSKGECNYLEAKLQFEHGVLEREDYYNEWILCKIHKSHVKKRN